MRFGSVCSGIEAASQAWNPLGWEASWLSEIEPFPCAALAHHYPHTPNLGDMTKFESWPHDEQLAIDLLCGGTPCQSFSVAGLRKGLDDPRGDLMLTFAAIAAKYRPRWVVWENVPGVLSSNGGRDFASFLGLLSGQSIEPPKNGWRNSGIISGYKNAYGLAYRVLDAQYFGVAQRRKRVFVVGHLGDWRRAAAVLFERHSLSGNPAPSRGAKKDTSPTISGGPPFSRTGNSRVEADAMVVARSGDSKDELIVPVVARCLTTSGGTKLDFETDTFLSVPFDTPQITSKTNRSNPNHGDECHTLGKSSHPPAIAYGIAGNCIGRKPENGGNGLGFDEETSYTLTKADVHGVAVLHGTQDPCVTDIAFAQGRNNGAENVVILPIAYAFDSLSSNSMKSKNPVSGCNEVDIAKTIDTTRPDPAKNQGGNAVLQPIAWTEELTPSINCASTMSRGGQGGRHEGVMTQAMQVRRLTTTECERLQGFPDGYTRVPNWNGWRKMDVGETPEQCLADGLRVKQNKKTGAWRVNDVDGPRYKALGNSWAVPCARWVGERIEMVDKI